MSNKPKRVSIHPNNKISDTEVAYNAFVKGKMNNRGLYDGKHFSNMHNTKQCILYK